MSNEATNDKATTETAPPSCAPSNSWAASLLAKLDAEILEVEAATISARENDEWPRYHRLCGQRVGLVQAKHWLKETQPNAALSHSEDKP